MAVLLSEIQWGEPLLPAAPDAAWEAELQAPRRPRSWRSIARVAASAGCARPPTRPAPTYMPAVLPERLYRMGHGDGAGEFLPLLLWREPRLHEGAGLFRVFHPAGRTRRADGRAGRQGTRLHRLLPQPGAIEAAPGRRRACRPAQARLYPGASWRDRLAISLGLLLQPRQHPAGVPAARRKFERMASGPCAGCSRSPCR